MGEKEDKEDWEWQWGAKIKSPVGMPSHIVRDAVEVTTKHVKAMLEADLTFEAGGLDVAKQVKLHFDAKYGPSWHVVIGKNFGSHVTHESKTFLYFYFSDTAFFDKAVMLFKIG